MDYSLIKSTIIFIIFAIYCTNCAAYNYYCSKEWCKSGKHFMCNPTALKTAAKFQRHVPLTFKIRRTFLEQHNQLRNSTAAEKKATRMRNLIWDHELAYLARSHTGVCPEKPSECHRTARFETVGLNMDGSQGGAERIEIITVMTTVFQKWQAKETAALKLMTHDQVSRVGCAIGYCTKCSGDRDHCYVVSCYYDMDTIDGVTAIETGDEPASKCSTWATVRDNKYTNLCHNTGRIFKKGNQ